MCKNPNLEQGLEANLRSIKLALDKIFDIHFGYFLFIFPMSD